MAELRPLPLALHVARVFNEFERVKEIYNLASSRFWRPDPVIDLGVRFHGMPASTALGPAAGPHNQLLQNIVSAWLGGARIIELKTVQVLDELKISRPCIYAANVGLNVEWSQELKLEQSLVEYIGAAMLIEMIKQADLLGLGGQAERCTQTIFDLSVGYDLAGISSDRVRDFIEQMMDAEQVINRLRQEIPDEFSRFRDLEYPTKLVRSITLSTFHGCPKDEIESICEFLLKDLGLNTIIKLNPTQLGKEHLEYLLHDRLGYTELEVNPKAYETALSLDEAVGIVERLSPLAEKAGLGIGVKFSNTLEVLNKGDYFSDEVMYLSGPPLHVIAVTLVEEWRKRVGVRFPVSFAAGVDSRNFYKMMSLGVTPITTCTDLLKTRGYGRLVNYLRTLEKEMKKIGAKDIYDYTLNSWGALKQREVLEAALEGGPIKVDDFKKMLAKHAGLDEALLAYGFEPTEVTRIKHRLWKQSVLYNTTVYADEVRQDERYKSSKNDKTPRKVESALYFWDCLSCDKCVPVCPNNANFSYSLEPCEIRGRNFKVCNRKVVPEERFVVVIEKERQWAVFADFCNECGNCDIFCPEYGGPFKQKPKFFSSMDSYKAFPSLDGFYLQHEGHKISMWGRYKGQEYFLEKENDSSRVRFTDHVVELVLDLEHPEEPLESQVVVGGHEGHVVDMKVCFWMWKCMEGVKSGINYVNIGWDSLVEQPV